MFDAGKTRMIGLPYGEKKLWRYVKPFSYNTSVSRTDRQTDGRTDGQIISISRVSVLTRDKNRCRCSTPDPESYENRGVREWVFDSRSLPFLCNNSHSHSHDCWISFPFPFEKGLPLPHSLPLSPLDRIVREWHFYIFKHGRYNLWLGSPRFLIDAVDFFFDPFPGRTS